MAKFGVGLFEIGERWTLHVLFGLICCIRTLQPELAMSLSLSVQHLDCTYVQTCFLCYLHNAGLNSLIPELSRALNGAFNFPTS